MKRVVLLVEDELDAREALARSLRRSGYTCLEAASVDEALAAVHDEAVLDAAVVDVRLGPKGPPGIELVAPLRARFRGLVVVVITAFAALALVKKALNDGAAYLLEKPFGAKDLTLALERALHDAEDTGHLVDKVLRRAELTEKEAEVARLVLKGLPSSEVGEVLGISDKTVRQHLSSVYTKCGVSSRAELFHHVFPS